MAMGTVSEVLRNAIERYMKQKEEEAKSAKASEPAKSSRKRKKKSAI
jgi:hypothetical protein